uniref:Putative ovule protein n=1 Tax=Solanum chacoense TaxID=4108 RepID=A0A0V0GLN1_SOLCH
MRITPASSCAIRRIELDYLRDDAAKRKPPLANTTQDVDPATLEVDHAPPTPTTEPSGMAMPSTYTSTAPPSSSSPPLTHALVHQNG